MAYIHRSVDGKITHITSSDGTQITPRRDVDGEIMGYDVSPQPQTSGSSGYNPLLDKYVSEVTTSFWQKIIKFNIFVGLIGLGFAVIIVVLYLVFDIDIFKIING